MRSNLILLLSNVVTITYTCNDKKVGKDED